MHTSDSLTRAGECPPFLDHLESQVPKDIHLIRGKQRRRVKRTSLSFPVYPIPSKISTFSPRGASYSLSLSQAHSVPAPQTRPSPRAARS